MEIGTKRTALLQLVAVWQRRFDFEVDTYHAGLVSSICSRVGRALCLFLERFEPWSGSRSSELNKLAFELHFVCFCWCSFSCRTWHLSFQCFWCRLERNHISLGSYWHWWCRFDCWCCYFLDPLGPVARICWSMAVTSGRSEVADTLELGCTVGCQSMEKQLDNWLVAAGQLEWLCSIHNYSWRCKYCNGFSWSNYWYSQCYWWPKVVVFHTWRCQKCSLAFDQVHRHLVAQLS